MDTKYIIAILLIVIILVAVLTIVILRKSKAPNASAKYNEYQMSRLKNYEYLNANYSKPNQTVLIGDSITEFYNSADLFENYTKETGISVYTRGISADMSDRMLERIEINALNIKPRNLVILIGVNDYEIIDNEHTANNVEKAVELTQEKCPETNIILQAVYPVNSVMSDFAKEMLNGKNNKEIGKINILLEKIAKNKNITFLNLTELLSDLKGNLKSSYTYDGIHLNVQGYEVVTKELIPLLK